MFHAAAAAEVPIRIVWAPREASFGASDTANGKAYGRAYSLTESISLLERDIHCPGTINQS